MADRVIWERTIDHDKIRERNDRFRKRFYPAAAIIVILVVILASWKDAIGAFLIVAAIGMFWRTTVRYQSLCDAANPVMTANNGKVILGNRTIVIDDVKRFTTIATSMQTSLLGRHSQIKVGKAIFRMDVPGTKREPQIVEFGWPNMTEDGVATVRAALEPELEGKWVEPGAMLDESEVNQSRRRPRLTEQFRR